MIRVPTHPGEMPLEEFLKPMGLVAARACPRDPRALPACERARQRAPWGDAKHGCAARAILRQWREFLALPAAAMGSLLGGEGGSERA